METSSKPVYLLGKANVGKTSLFNLLTGSYARVANYHGATTKINKAHLLKDTSFKVYDLPGAYSLESQSADEALTLETLKSCPQDSVWLFVLDAVELEDNLKSITELLSGLKEKTARIVFAVNMMDEARANDIQLNLKGLEEKLDLSVVPISAKKNENTEALISELTKPNLKSAKVKEAHSKLSEIKFNNYILKDDRIAFKRMHSIDRLLTAPWFGPLFFTLVMILLFQSIFSWASPIMDLVESIMVWLSESFSTVSNPYLKSFIQDAVFGGLGSFLVFAPQIFILSFLIKALEESGYLARASIICHRALKLFGLSGESFIPLLTSHACAIPGIYAARHIKSQTVRTLTLLSLPLTLCSARLPVYALLISVLIPPVSFLSGFIGAQGLALLSLYGFGVILSLIVSYILKTKVHQFKSTEDLFVLELPRYKIPSFLMCFKSGFMAAKDFIKDAGLVIFLTNTFIWFLATFPNGPGELKTSFLSSVGKIISPLSAPLGFDWPATVAVLTSFLARETFVSTLGTLYGVETESTAPLSELLKAQNYSLATSLSLIVFFAIALQCVSTVALLRKELPNQKMAGVLFWAYFALAYLASFITYQIFNLI